MKFVKITDETTALSLEERGFSFTKETINKDQAFLRSLVVLIEVRYRILFQST